MTKEFLNFFNVFFFYCSSFRDSTYTDADNFVEDGVGGADYSNGNKLDLL